MIDGTKVPRFKRAVKGAAIGQDQRLTLRITLRFKKYLLDVVRTMRYIISRGKNMAKTANLNIRIDPHL